MARRRLDDELVRRGLAASLSEARDAVGAGLVTVAGAPALKAASLVAPEAPLALISPLRRYVSRGGEKLRAALDRFEVDPGGLDCLDAGASTGGFTDCLLGRGAARVVTLDVGYGQLAWELRVDGRVIVLERRNARDLASTPLPLVPRLVVADLSFISLRIVARALTACAAPDAGFVVLVKPQFEAARADVQRGGVVRDPTIWRRVLREVTGAFEGAGAAPKAVMASPLLGPAGNVEFLMHAEAGGARTALNFDDALEQAEAQTQAQVRAVRTR